MQHPPRAVSAPGARALTAARPHARTLETRSRTCRLLPSFFICCHALLFSLVLSRPACSPTGVDNSANDGAGGGGATANGINNRPTAGFQARSLQQQPPPRPGGGFLRSRTEQLGQLQQPLSLQSLQLPSQPHHHQQQQHYHQQQSYYPSQPYGSNSNNKAGAWGGGGQPYQQAYHSHHHQQQQQQPPPPSPHLSLPGGGGFQQGGAGFFAAPPRVGGGGGGGPGPGGGGGGGGGGLYVRACSYTTCSSMTHVCFVARVRACARIAAVRVPSCLRSASPRASFRARFLALPA